MRIATVETLSKYMAAGMNIMLIGRHGTGKTSILRQACTRLNYTMTEMNAPLMDPYIDLVGVPEVAKGENGAPSFLTMVRKHNIDNADVVFIDEINRGPDVVRNGTMELVNEKAINGEPLPNLKCTISSCNPAGGDYLTEILDPAQMDRFDVILTMSDRVNREYFRSLFPDNEKYADVFVDWQHSLKFEDEDSNGNTVDRAPYVSPRRVEKLAKAFQLFPLLATLEDVLGDNSDSLALSKLHREAKFALEDSDVESSGEIINDLISCDVDDVDPLISSNLDGILDDSNFVGKLGSNITDDDSAQRVDLILEILDHALRSSSVTGKARSTMLMKIISLRDKIRKEHGLSKA